jgi:hypothetical protein
MKRWWLPAIFKGIVVVALALTVFSSVVMLLWNALIPDLFRGPSLTFWQSAGLIVLSHILLRGPGMRHHWMGSHFRHRMKAKLSSMSPEEREKFRAACEDRFRGFPHGKPDGTEKI